MQSDSKIAHLEMIQGVIERMAANCFHVKGWTMAVVSALLALSLTKQDLVFAQLAYFPLVVFWALDGYYLSLEKAFRHLYNRVRLLDDTKVDFAMSLASGDRGVRSTLKGMCAVSTAIFHLAAVVVTTTVLLYMRCAQG